MFKSAILKLTAYYLAILMSISIVFSLLVYTVSANEFGERLRFNGGMSGLTQRRVMVVDPDVAAYVREQVEQSRRAVMTNLIMTNLAVLLLGGGISYLMARRTLRPIEEAHRSLERFTADASHELRTPLAAMKSEIEVALRTNKPSKRILRSNLEEVDKLSLLADSLLKLARSDDGIKKSPVDLKTVAAEAINRCLASAERKSILLEPDLRSTLVTGDRNMLKELAVILIDNAVKYSPDKSKIVVGTRAKSLFVSDKGKGIKASELPHIFERFYRGDASRSSDGYGLGLSIAKQIADKHGAKIEVDSRPGAGSTFTLKF